MRWFVEIVITVIIALAGGIVLALLYDYFCKKEDEIKLAARRVAAREKSFCVWTGNFCHREERDCENCDVFLAKKGRNFSGSRKIGFKPRPAHEKRNFDPKKKPKEFKE